MTTRLYLRALLLLCLFPPAGYALAPENMPLTTLLAKVRDLDKEERYIEARPYLLEIVERAELVEEGMMGIAAEAYLGLGKGYYVEYRNTKDARHLDTALMWFRKLDGFPRSRTTVEAEAIAMAVYLAQRNTVEVKLLIDKHLSADYEDTINLTERRSLLDVGAILAQNDPDLKPWYEELRRKSGDFCVTKAKEYIEEGDYRQGYFHLHDGVAYNPANLEGRKMLSEFTLLAKHQPDEARKILKDGIPYALEDVDYLKRYFKLCFSYQLDGEILMTADEVIAKSNSGEVRKLAALAAATAHYYRGNFDQSEDYIRDYGLDEKTEGFLLAARLTWDRGQQEKAIADLEAILGEHENDEPFLALLSRYYRDIGDYEKVRQYAALRSANAPLSVAPRIDLLYAYDNTGDSAKAEQEIDAILEQFGDNENALMALANYCTDSGRTEVAKRIYEMAEQNEYNMAPFALLWLEAYLVAEDYQQAIVLCEELEAENPEWLERNRAVFNSLRSLAHYGTDNEDGHQRYLEEFLAAGDVRTDTQLAVSRRYKKLGALDAAHAILAHAHQLNPNNQAALTKLIEVELDLGLTDEAAAHLEELLQMRHPHVDVLKRAYDTLKAIHLETDTDHGVLLQQLLTELQKRGVEG